MALLDKDKMMKGFGQAVDAVNGAADKTGEFIKENEIDKKAKNVLSGMDRELNRMVKDVKGYFKKDNQYKKKL